MRIGVQPGPRPRPVFRAHKPYVPPSLDSVWGFEVTMCVCGGGGGGDGGGESR